MDDLITILISAGADVGKQLTDALVPIVVSGITGLALAIFGLLKKKLELAALEVTAAVEARAQSALARGDVKTPSSRKLSEAETELIAKLGTTLMGQIASKLGTTSAINKMVPLAETIQATIRASMMPPPGEDTSPVTVPPRSPTGFSGTAFPAVEFTELPKEPATLDDGGPK